MNNFIPRYYYEALTRSALAELRGHMTGKQWAKFKKRLRRLEWQAASAS